MLVKECIVEEKEKLETDVLTKCGLTRAELKARGYTHLATHKNDSPKGHFKKGQGLFVVFNKDSGEYVSGMTCLLEPELNYDLEEI